jgi:integrase
MDFLINNQFVSGCSSFAISPPPSILPARDSSPPRKADTAVLAELLIKSRRAANRSEYYVGSLNQYLKRFAKEFPDLSLVTTAQIETWLERFKSPHSRATWLGRISSLFNWAVRKDYIEKNPCTKIDRIILDHGDPVTLTVKQAKTLLLNCPLWLQPWLAFGMFAGVRPEEIQRLRWQDVNIETRTARVNGKTRRRRLVPLEDAAIAILKECWQQEGNVAPSRSSVRRWIRKARHLIGGKWTPDILRHTAASMLLAKYGDAGKVATSLGNSPQILLTHYNNPVTKEESDRFWAIRGVSDNEPLSKAA